MFSVHSPRKQYFLPVFSLTVSIQANSSGQVETGSSRQVKNSNFFKTYFRRHSDVNRNLSGVLIVYLLTISGHISLNIFPQNIRGNKKRSLVWNELTLHVPTPQNGQTHLNNSSAVADELFKCVWPFCRVNI